MDQRKKHPFYTNQNKKYKNHSIGDFTFGKPMIYFDPTDKNQKVSIGKFCSIARNVTIYAGAEHHYNWISQYSFNKFKIFNEKQLIKTKGPVIIGNDVWIGDSAFILSEVTIGDGAVIGANSVVSKNVDPYSIVVGNPAKHIKYRFSNEQIASLLKIQWWNWDIQKIENSFPLLLSDNIDNFIQKYQ